jgi:hypothetical protein
MFVIEMEQEMLPKITPAGVRIPVEFGLVGLQDPHRKCRDIAGSELRPKPLEPRISIARASRNR